MSSLPEVEDEMAALLAHVRAEARREGAVAALREAADDIPQSADPYDVAAEWLIERADQIQGG